MVLLKLFLSFFKIGMFAVGGAYSFLPLIEKEVVERYHWLTKGEFLDVLGIVRIFPGAISIKYATYTGHKMAGIPGAIAANLGNLLGPAILIIFALNLYTKYKHLPLVRGAFNAVQLAVFAMIIAVAFQLINLNQLIQLRSLLIVIAAFLLFVYTRVHPALIIIITGVIGAFWK